MHMVLANTKHTALQVPASHQQCTQAQVHAHTHPVNVVHRLSQCMHTLTRCTCTGFHKCMHTLTRYTCTGSHKCMHTLTRYTCTGSEPPARARSQWQMEFEPSTPVSAVTNASASDNKKRMVLMRAALGRGIMHLHVCVCEHVCVYMFVSIHVYVCASASACVSVNVCVCVRMPAACIVWTTKYT
jgi:hypothetical protein